ncbi:hypothetical protein SAMN06298211_101504 [Prevotellaceae bacterium MN60]|nr:hypothetical protein SAMN06298211_101504 [Prevotellaceae bacterium MN60]
MFCDDLSHLLPNYNNICYTEGIYTVYETSADSKVKGLTWTNANFQIFNPDIAKDLTAFFDKAKAGDIFNFNCDGVFLFQGTTQKYLFLCELKSTFDSSDIYHACQQIISTYIKLSMVLNLLPNFRKDDVIVKGFIVSRPAEKTYLRDLHKLTMMGCKSNFTTEAEFCYELCYNSAETYMMQFKNCHQLKDIPLGSETITDRIEFHHINVLAPNSEISIDAMKYAD